MTLNTGGATQGADDETEGEAGQTGGATGGTQHYGVIGRVENGQVVETRFPVVSVDNPAGQEIADWLATLPENRGKTF